jgi:uncharacterized phiE125 gp8 family phage protein
MIKLHMASVPLDPVTLDEAKAHLRVESGDDDALITALVSAGSRNVEEYCRRSLMVTSWALLLNKFTEYIELPRAPVASVETVQFKSGDQTVILAGTQYILNSEVSPALLYAAPDVDWPTWGDDIQSSVRISYTAGVADAANVPAPIKAAILLMVGHLYENREAVIVGTIAKELPLAVESLLLPYRVSSL